MARKRRNRKEKDIEVTVELLKELFKKYNKLYFDNNLMLPTFSLECNDNIAGEFRYRFIKKGGQWTLGRKVIHINGNIIWNEQTLRSVLIHEMIHYYVQSRKKEPSRDGDFQHWGLFWITRLKLNWKYNLDIKNNYFFLKLKNRNQ